MNKKSIPRQFIAILLILVFTLSGCKFIIYKAYGIKKPRIENEKRLNKFLKKKKLRQDNYLTIKAAYFLSTLKGRGIPDADFFDAEGRYIEYRSTDTSCNAGVFGFIPALDPTGVYNKPGTKVLLEEYGKLLTPSGQNPAPLPKADFYLFIYWTAWTGRLNKDHVKVWEDAAIANTKARIHVIKVNMDIQSHWSETDREKIIEILKKSKK